MVLIHLDSRHIEAAAGLVDGEGQSSTFLRGEARIFSNGKSAAS
jgi:hypothetical protein